MTKFQIGAILTCLTMDGQMHTIGKAIRPLFADPVTYYLFASVLPHTECPAVDA